MIIKQLLTFVLLLLSAEPCASSNHDWTTGFELRHRRRSTFRQAALVDLRGGAASSSEPASTAALKTSGGGAQNEEGASIPALVFNLVKAIVGVGVLSLPAGIAAFGNAPSALVPALALITIIGLLSGFGFALIGKVCAYTGATSYAGAWEQSVGPKTAWIPAWSTTCKTSLACLAFSMVLGDTFSGLLGQARTPTLLGVTVCILLPLCWMKDLKSLAPFSLLGVMGMAYTALAMTLRWVDGSYKLPGGKLLEQVTDPKLQPHFGSKGLEAVFHPSSLILVCMLSTAYMAHFNAPKFYLELRNNTLPRYHQVVGLGFGLSIILTGFISAVGFVTFGDGVSGLVLNNYAPKDLFMSASRVAVAVSLVFSYPLAFQGCRDGFMDLLHIKNRSNQVLNLTTVILLAVLTSGAIVLKDVSFVLAFGGATLGNALTYLYPAIMYANVCHKQGRKEEKPAVLLAKVSAVLGVLMGAVGAKMAIDSQK